ncbi:TVP38/TMEM64 family membrane protein [Trifolium repens]|nr:TVP38/TMEM64 family membrane protein [Trifolium repens]
MGFISASPVSLFLVVVHPFHINLFPSDSRIWWFVFRQIWYFGRQVALFWLVVAMLGGGVVVCVTGCGFCCSSPIDGVSLPRVAVAFSSCAIKPPSSGSLCCLIIARPLFFGSTATVVFMFRVWVVLDCNLLRWFCGVRRGSVPASWRFCQVTDGGRSGGFVGVWIRNCVGCCLEEVFLSVVRVRDGAETTEEMAELPATVLVFVAPTRFRWWFVALVMSDVVLVDALYLDNLVLVDVDGSSSLLSFVRLEKKISNLANLEGLRARSSLKQPSLDLKDEEEECRPWRRRITMAFSWASAFRITLLLLLLVAVIVACFTLPIEKMMKDFLIWVDRDLGRWGPLVLAVAYIPLTVLAVPASVLTLGGGYLFGLPLGFVADSIGATVGAGAAFLLGRTIGRPFVVSRLKDYPQFRSVAIAIRRSGFKIVLLLRLVPLLPFNMLNYLLSVTPVSLVEYMLASWLGMMPITLALVYVGTTLKDLSDVTHGWGEFSKTRWAFIIIGLVISVVLMICVTKVAKSALDKALAENEDIDGIGSSPELPIVSEASPSDLNQPLIIKIDSTEDNHEK